MVALPRGSRSKLEPRMGKNDTTTQGTVVTGSGWGHIHPRPVCGYVIWRGFELGLQPT